jgi:hypothetical protein
MLTKSFNTYSICSLTYRAETVSLNICRRVKDAHPSSTEGTKGVGILRAEGRISRLSHYHGTSGLAQTRGESVDTTVVLILNPCTATPNTFPTARRSHRISESPTKGAGAASAFENGGAGIKNYTGLGVKSNYRRNRFSKCVVYMEGLLLGLRLGYEAARGIL